MLGLFKNKKNKGSLGSIPEPPMPTSGLADDGKPHPDDHPLDAQLDSPPEEPSTNFAEDPAHDDINNAIEQASVSKHNTPAGIEELPFDPSSIPDMPQEQGPIQQDNGVMGEQPEAIKEPSFEIPPDDEANADQVPEIQEPEQEEPQEQQVDSIVPESMPQTSSESDDDLPSFGEQEISHDQQPMSTVPHQDVPLPKQQGFGIYIDLRDYERIFKEIRYIDSFSKKCFRAVLNLRDISGNQNKLLDKFQQDLDYVNERLAFMDQAFFEQNR